MIKCKWIIIIILFLSQSQLYGQATGELVKYTPDFRFKDGIYLNFDQIKNNNPIPKAKLLTSTDYNDREFFKKLFETGKIYFYDNMGIRKEIITNSIWGYARNGVLYIQVQESFNRITYVGSICHFVADITTYDPRYYGSPYNSYDPYYYPYSPYGYYGYGSYYSRYPYGYNPYRNNLARNEIRQYIIEFETGNIAEFDLKNTEMMLMKDPELYEEFVQLPRRKKKDLMFVYIRRYNERNPLFIPENN